MIEEIVRLVRAGDTDAAVQLVQRDGAPGEIALRFDEVVRDLYWKARDLPAAIAVGQGGIDYCLGKMGEATDGVQRDFFGTRAKVMAFNVSSFAWPGWDEAGISPSARDVEAGLAAGRLNLRLAEDLGKPAERVQDAHWLLGAHLLAANDPGGALDEFTRCSPGTRPLYRGYELLARVVCGERGAQEAFDELLAGMRAGGDAEDSESAAAHLATAHRVFVVT